MNQKELTKTLLMIEINPLASMIYTKIFQRFKQKKNSQIDILLLN